MGETHSGNPDAAQRFVPFKLRVKFVPRSIAH
jgi:hypothetical protein